MPMPDANTDLKGMHIIFATSKGKIRKNSLDDFTSINSSGKIAIKSKGIRGINLQNDDSVVSLSIIDAMDKKSNGKSKLDTKFEKDAKQNYILSITENGYGKRTSHYDYRVINRGGKGIIGIVNSRRNGDVSSSFPVFDGDEILISTDKGRVIRTSVKEIRIANRNTQGVRIIKLSGDEKVVSAIKIDDNLV